MRDKVCETWFDSFKINVGNIQMVWLQSSIFVELKSEELFEGFQI